MKNLITQNVTNVAHTQPVALNTWPYYMVPSHVLDYSSQEEPFIFPKTFYNMKKYKRWSEVGKPTSMTFIK